MANALVVRKTQLPSSQKTCRAAQYVRMSTERQRYSIQNQAAVIGAYAHAHNLTIVRTYSDEGESGLQIRNRAALTQLIEDVRAGQTDFGHLLVYDVSRWGRFQDIDESAHYEFICKQAGIKVEYCAEQFDNDGSMLSSIVKNLKRVMAAEYSRELSAKVHAGLCRFASLGFKPGGRPGYALLRELVDEKLQPKGILKNGDRKYLTTDHVRLRPGSADEVAVVKWIFQRFLMVRSETAIASELNLKGIPTGAGVPWNRAHVGRLLRNENYIGNLIYNRRSRKLREKNVNNSPDLWIKSEGCVESIVEQSIFLNAKKIIEERRVDLTEEEMLARLRRTLMKKRRLSPAIINETVGLPCAATYMTHFGSLRNAYRLIGYKSKRDCDYIESRRTWADLATELASQVAAEIEGVGGSAAPSKSRNCLRVTPTVSISFRIARWHPGKKESHSPLWSIERLTSLPAGWIVAIRLSEHNQSVLDYLLLQVAGTEGRLIRFSETARIRRGIDRFDTADALVRAVSRRVNRPRRISQTKPTPPNRQSRSSQSRRKTGRAPR
jgi:DNA invertase Pin-like site-specific DNA recombinase